MVFPVGNIVTGIATVISVVVANRLSSSQSGKARLWELRREAYGVILSELAAVERLCNIADVYMQENIHGYFESDTRTEHETRMNKHMAVARQRFSDDYLIMSDKFIALFQAFTDDLDAGPPDEFFPESRERFAEAVREYRTLLLAQGQKETRFSRFRRLFPDRMRQSRASGRPVRG